MKDILAFFSWYLVISLVGWLSLPITFRFFPWLASRGYALIRPVSLLIWGYCFWILGLLGILQNNLGGVIVSLVLLAGASLLILRRGTWNLLKDWLSQNWKTILVVEVIFFVMFAGWTIVRAANPDAAYTEKPMELAFINSILHSVSFPPQDPWLSGYAISYYYFGYVLISMLIRVTGVTSSVAFNLSSSLWFGLTAIAAYGIVYDLVHAWKTSHTKPEDGAETKQVSRLARLGGLLGPFFILILANLEGLLEILYARGLFWKTGADGTVSSRFWNWLGILELNVPPSQPASWILNRSTGWIWWRGSRVIQDLSISGGNIEVIDEFPFFTYLLSDLHPHLLAMPFCLLAMALALNTFLSNENSTFPLPLSFRWFRRWETWLTILILGSLAFLNIWDFPIYVGLFAVVVLYKRIQQSGWSWNRLWEFLVCGLTLGIAGAIVFLPFYLGFQSQAGGILPSMEYMTRGINFWVMFGIFLSLILIWLIFQVRQKELSFSISKGFRFAAFVLLGLFILSFLWGFLLLNMFNLGISQSTTTNPFLARLGEKIIMAGQAFSGLHGNYSTFAILRETISRRITSPGTWLTLGVLLTFVWGFIAVIKPADTTEPIPENSGSEIAPKMNIKIFVLILILFGVGLTVFPEFLYLRDQFGSRMNTIFKFYFQAWIFWSIGAAFASIELLNTLKRWKYALFSVFWCVLLLAGSAYPVLMLLNKTNQFSPAVWTLDGNEYISRYTPDEYIAINWLSTQETGVVTEAVGGSYSDYARVSTRTGFPTVLGWPGHESQWRGGAFEMGDRGVDIAKLYETSLQDETISIIQKYNIRYIYLGNMERTQYKVSQSKFDALLDVVYSNGSVIIYEVPPNFGG